MGANLLRLPIAGTPATTPETAAPAERPKAAQRIVELLERIVEQNESLLAFAAAIAGQAGTLPIAAAKPTIDETELAEILRQTPRTLRQKAWAARLPPAEKFGRKRLYDRAEVARWIAGGMPSRAEWIKRGRK